MGERIQSTGQLFQQEGAQLARDLAACLAEQLASPAGQTLTMVIGDRCRRLAQGFDLLPPGDLMQLVYFGKGACTELETRIHQAMANHLLKPERAEELLRRSRSVSSLLLRYSRGAGHPDMEKAG